MNQSENRSSTNEDVQEESGWTTYLEDFSLMNNQRENYRSSCYSHEDDDHSFGHNSLLSDAASNAAWKNYCNTTNYNQVIGNECPTKKLNLKKLPRNKKINDPDLEDTASSPVNSPKLSNFKQMEINYRRTENISGNFLGNEGSSRQFQEMQKVERGNVSLENNGYTDLKKKGLCLVPLSMFVNYQG
ncbi:vascular-related unknown protein 1-like [Lycium barbarum]|uniref:vascular-related unknown protein 1-like n=1 Tax=Lycium barbarum TaxID=112863 RepID=UPI00293E3E00|nr:vascular-related unknown protein 1-like [Lycium barbarum]